MFNLLNIVAKTGDKAYGTKHLVIIGICVLVVVVSSILLKKVKKETMFKIILGCGIVSELIKVLYYIITNEDTMHGILPKGDLPFHLCSIQIIFIIVLNISKKDNVKKFFMSFMLPTCLIGGVAAILVPTSSSLSELFIITFQYFMYHCAIIVFAIYMIISKEITFDFKDYLHCLLMLFITFFVAIYINSIIYVEGAGDINFMYVVHSPSESMPYLNTKHGWSVYMIHYGLLAIFVCTMFYIKQIILQIKGKFQKSNNVDNNELVNQ